MSNIKLHNDSNLSATYVSNQFIDHYMTSANGEYVKVYLYLLRCMGSSQCSFSISAAADLFEHTEKDILRALHYWEKMNLLHLEYDQKQALSSIQLVTPQPSLEELSTEDKLEHTEIQEVQEQEASPSYEREPALDQDGATPSAPPSYTADQLAQFQQEDNVKELLFVTEHYLKRPLTPTDMNTILFWYEELKLPLDLVEYLVEYCIGKGHTSLQYMNKVAISWKETGIDTVVKAKRTASSFSKMHYAAMRALGISGRNLIPSETAMVDTWANTYGFSQELIEEACRRTIAATHQPNFEYADSILKSWYQHQVHNLTDVARLDSAYQKSKAAGNRKSASQNKFNNFSQRRYDYDKLEKQLLGKY